MCSYMIGLRLPITITRDNNVSRTGKIIAIIPANHVARAMKIHSIGLYGELHLWWGRQRQDGRDDDEGHHGVAARRGDHGD